MITTGEVPIPEVVVVAAAAMIAIRQENPELRALQSLKIVKNFRMYFCGVPKKSWIQALIFMIVVVVLLESIREVYDPF